MSAPLVGLADMRPYEFRDACSPLPRCDYELTNNGFSSVRGLPAILSRVRMSPPRRTSRDGVGAKPAWEL